MTMRDDKLPAGSLLGGRVPCSRAPHSLFRRQQIARQVIGLQRGTRADGE